MTKYKFKDENSNWQELVQDVKVNGTSAFNGEIADIKLKTINYQDITGTGNIAISGGTSTDVQINGTSIVVNDVANILTESAYNSTTNKIATVNDIPTDTGDLTNNAGFITGITSGDVTTALGYTPYNSSNPSDYQENVIETVKVNGTALTVTSKEVDIIVPTDTNELTNSAGFITSSDLSGYATETWVGNQGYITGIVSSDVTTALGYIPYNSSNPDGYTSNVGTVTSVNNIIPVSGDVTLTANDVGAQETLASGTNIKTINSVSILGSGDIDTKSQDVTVLSGTSITLADNSINTLTPSGNTTFTLPTVSDTTVFHQILVQLNMPTVYTIDLGTTVYFGGEAPDLSNAGNYNLIYEYDNSLSAWVVGAVSKA